MDRPIFDGLLHTGKPDLEALYRVGKIPMYARTSVVGWVSTSLGRERPLVGDDQGKADG